MSARRTATIRRQRNRSKKGARYVAAADGGLTGQRRMGDVLRRPEPGGNLLPGIRLSQAARDALGGDR
jgi:hypothetical protein